MSAIISKIKLAEELDCSTRHLERLMKEGLPFIPFGERAKRFDLDSVKNWLKSREVCLSGKTKRGAGMQKFASMDNAYTEYCRQARAKRQQKARKPNSENH